MKFEQPASLNRYVDPTIPINWALRWRVLKPVLPLLVCCSVLFIEQLALRMWLQGRSLISELPLLLLCAISPIPMVMAAVEVQLRVAQRTKRTLTLESKGISLSPAKCNRVAWNRVRAWRLEPLADNLGMSKLTVEYSLDKKGERRREWLMVLQRPEQETGLLAELRFFGQVVANADPGIQRTDRGKLVMSRRFMRGMIAISLAFWCFVHGLPLLGVGLLHSKTRPDTPRANSKFTDEEIAKLRQTVVRYFNSGDQFRRFILITGGGLTALGVGLYFLGIYSMKEEISSPNESMALQTKGNPLHELCL
jgi:hypothetical protein